MQSRIFNTYSDNDTPEQTYQKAFANRHQIVATIKLLEAQGPFIKGLSKEQSRIWETEYQSCKNKLTTIDLSISNWLTYYPDLAMHNSLNSILPTEQPSTSQASHSNLTYANSSATLFSIELPDFQPGVSTKTYFEKSTHRASVKARR
jgi:hypothetical protein